MESGNYWGLYHCVQLSTLLKEGEDCWYVPICCQFCTVCLLPLRIIWLVQGYCQLGSRNLGLFWSSGRFQEQKCWESEVAVRGQWRCVCSYRSNNIVNDRCTTLANPLPTKKIKQHPNSINTLLNNENSLDVTFTKTYEWNVRWFSEETFLSKPILSDPQISFTIKLQRIIDKNIASFNKIPKLIRSHLHK